MDRRFACRRLLAPFQNGIALAFAGVALLMVVGALWQTYMIVLSVLADDQTHQRCMRYLAPFCHQMPERSYAIGGTQLPVCARCVGIVAGVLMAPLIHLWIRSRRRTVWLFLAMIASADIAMKPLGVDAWSYWRTFAGIGLGLILLDLCVCCAQACWLTPPDRDFRISSAMG